MPNIDNQHQITVRIKRALTGFVFAIAMVSVAAPVWAQEICWTSGGGQFYDAIHYCVSSVLAPQNGHTYGPQNLAQGDSGKAWCEGVAGPGIGETITIRIDGGPAFRRLQVSNGYGRSPQTYANNSRIKTVEITADTGVQTRVNLADQNGMLPVYLPKPARRWIQLKIIDVYPGDRFADTCLAYVTPDFEYEEELLQKRQNR